MKYSMHNFTPRIPVLMDTSDRGLIEVERFDLEPNRRILHGVLDHLDLSKAVDLKNEQKMQFACYGQN